MTAVHIVKPGEHIAAIATRFGFENFSELWNHPNNAELKERRKSPFLLAVGDELFIPDRTLLIFSRATASSHDFKVNIDRIEVKLRLLGLDAKPRANTELKVEAEPPQSGEASSSTSRELTTDGDGKVSVEISKTCEVGGITLDGIEFEMHVGGLDPIDTDTGLAQRLTNLGYFVPPLAEPEPAGAGPNPGIDSAPTDSAADEADARDADESTEEEEQSDDLRSSIEEFQCDQGLTVNGKKDDPAMLAKLEELHGS